MHWAVLLAACIALAGTYLVRLPRPMGAAVPMVCFTLGLLVTALGLRIVADAAGFGRVTEFDRIVNRAADLVADDPAPLVVFTGTSVSRRGVDDARLTVALRAAGLPHRAINLSLEAASLEERDAHLNAFIMRTGRIPDLVMVEIAEAVEVSPADLIAAAPFSPRALEHYDLPTAFRVAWTLTPDRCAGDGCTAERARIIAHGVLNLFNTGLMSSGEAEASVGAVAAYRPGDAPRLEVDADTRTDGLSLTMGAPTAELGSTRPRRGWNARERQRQALAAMGISRIGYYLPPVVDPRQRRVAAHLCGGELFGSICIAPTDPVLLDALDKPVWLDETHLMDDGASVYARWLAMRLARALAEDGSIAMDTGPGGIVSVRGLQ